MTAPAPGAWLARLAAVLALAALGAGCARLTPPGPPLAERLAYDQAARERYRLDPQWWKIYGDARLDGLVDLALRNNLDLAQAALSVRRALIQAGLLQASLTPTLSGGLAASSRRDLTSAGAAAQTSFSGEVGLSYELDLWRRVARTADAAGWEYQATLEDREAARLTLINKVVDAFHNLAYLNDALAADAANLKNLLALAEAARARRQAGKTTALEQAQAEQAVLNAENTRLGRQSQAQTAAQTLRNLLNLQPSQAPNLEGLTLSRREPPEMDLSLPLSVLANRPDLKAAEFRLHQALAGVEAAERAWLPSISLSAALSSSGAALSRAFNQPLGAVGLNLSLPFLDWAKVRANLRLAETDFEAARLNFEQVLTTALNEAETCYRGYELARATLDNARRKQVQDDKIAGYQLARYQSGAAELADWLNAVNTAQNSRLAALNALYQLLAAENKTWQALGGRYLDSEAPRPSL